MSSCRVLKQIYSTVLLIFSVVTIMGLIAQRQTRISADFHPILAYIVIWISIVWLSMIEGSQGSLVGLSSINADLYRDSHPIAYKCTAITNQGNNINRYLIGRQFMVVLVVFCVNLCGGPLESASGIWNYPNWVNAIFLTVGFAMILFTCMVGQLNSQVNASLSMLDYINNYFALVTVWVALGIEYSGLLHSSYLLQMFVTYLSDRTIDERTKASSRSLSWAGKAFFWTRFIMSLAILIFCFAVTLEALFSGKTTMWEGVPPGSAVVVFFILMSIVGMLEGMQIAFFAVAKIPAAERGNSTFALKTCNLLFQGGEDGTNNLPQFMIGRQLFVVTCMFFIARVTSIQIPQGEYAQGDQGRPSANNNNNIFGVSDTVQEILMNSGLLGALITTTVGSLAWQLIASAFPLSFLANPLTYALLRVCLFLEATGICSGAWVLANIHQRVAGFQRDEVYIGTAEDRAKREMGDDTDHFPIGPGYIVKLPGFAHHAPKSLKELLATTNGGSYQFDELYIFPENDSSSSSFSEPGNSSFDGHDEEENISSTSSLVKPLHNTNLIPTEPLDEGSSLNNTRMHDSEYSQEEIEEEAGTESGDEEENIIYPQQEESFIRTLP
mmetsp:Transcript_16144/g.30497  ORF Transcript_16144/g.30497 Transcript_16144/m.30497 type:complete len:611 (+) Transcript_16144:395-2227(+)